MPAEGVIVFYYILFLHKGLVRNALMDTLFLQFVYCQQVNLGLHTVCMEKIRFFFLKSSLMALASDTMTSSFGKAEYCEAVIDSVINDRS